MHTLSPSRGNKTSLYQMLEKLQESQDNGHKNDPKGGSRNREATLTTHSHRNWESQAKESSSNLLGKPNSKSYQL